MRDMPDEPRGGVKEEHLHALARHISAKWVCPCPMCGVTDWVAAGYVNLMVSSAPGRIELGGTHLPSVAVVCKNCGVTIIVNGITAGMFPPEEPPSSPRQR